MQKKIRRTNSVSINFFSIEKSEKIRKLEIK